MEAGKRMIKIIALIVGGVFLMSLGIYLLSVANLPALILPLFNIKFPDVNWGLVGFVVLAGSAASFGSAFVAVRAIR